MGVHDVSHLSQILSPFALALLILARRTDQHQLVLPRHQVGPQEPQEASQQGGRHGPAGRLRRPRKVRRLR